MQPRLIFGIRKQPRSYELCTGHIIAGEPGAVPSPCPEGVGELKFAVVLPP